MIKLEGVGQTMKVGIVNREPGEIKVPLKAVKTMEILFSGNFPGLFPSEQGMKNSTRKMEYTFFESQRDLRVEAQNCVLSF